ncbi:DEAD/DEAH box helicase [Gynuella sunshinyii]|uniref:ATP-dependent RNA helicase DeaD n=1 Tax=Gynuella sunshinyii YC6258 TaxID=1445510 RepID=A0A0C5VQC4_9GAMM|nr:DEAD/DEAH box helicase [Gynuella sunshinyii]AJQ92484.1 superfamily II DNA and RNA helicase [Gynuella sunshinyii YC6258]
MTDSEHITSFADLQLSEPVMKALSAIGYESPSPIQSQTIPSLMSGRDLLGIAQTGTGKTAAFALPVLHNLDIQQVSPQALVLAPTRELAIQVAEAFQSYAHFIKGFHVLPIYGGQDMRVQLRALKRPVHVVVGTPGRVMDHLRKGSLDLSHLKTVVLDEADEMLRMGFIEDVEWILEHTPKERQVALFSATMPEPIRKVTANYLKDPVEVRVARESTTVAQIEQCHLMVQPNRKLDALTRVMEVEDFDAAIVFVRTKTATTELAEKLEARGFSSAALNGDMNQAQREKTIERLKKGKLDVAIATDVAARGLDVERISHVINYDIPYDSEAYVHRIGRTGRAGRSGKAILLITPREQRLLRTIEQHTRAPIPVMKLPTAEQLSEQRIKEFKDTVLAVVQDIDGTPDKDILVDLIMGLHQEHQIEPINIAAALGYIAQQGTPLLVGELSNDFIVQPRGRQDDRRDDRREKSGGKSGERKSRSLPDGMKVQKYRLDVGRRDGIRPGDIVGAIANEAGIESQFIGNIRLSENFSIVELPDGMPKEVFKQLKNVKVRNRPLNIRPWEDEKPSKSRHRAKKG